MSLLDELRDGLPCLGILLGMQLLIATSEESHGDGIGLIDGRVGLLDAPIVPQMGWNDIEVTDKQLGGDNAWQVWAEDPNGVRIEFHQYTDDSMQLVGGTCPVTW